MNLMKSIGAAFAALALCTVSLSVPTTALAATPEEIAAAYENYVYATENVASKEAELAVAQEYFDNSGNYCWTAFYYEQWYIPQCMRDVEDWWVLESYRLGQEILVLEGYEADAYDYWQLLLNE